MIIAQYRTIEPRVDECLGALRMLSFALNPKIETKLKHLHTQLVEAQR